MQPLQSHPTSTHLCKWHLTTHRVPSGCHSVMRTPLTCSQSIEVHAFTPSLHASTQERWCSELECWYEMQHTLPTWHNTYLFNWNSRLCRKRSTHSDMCDTISYKQNCQWNFKSSIVLHILENMTRYPHGWCVCYIQWRNHSWKQILLSFSNYVSKYLYENQRKFIPTDQDWNNASSSWLECQ